MLSAQTIRQIFPQCPDPESWAQALRPAMERYRIDTPARMASFLAQTGHESAQFSRQSENLRYRSGKRLMQVWPKRFPSEQATGPYLDNPERLANFVYAKRMGNGDASSGDGYRYRGRGILQITGRSNYAAVGQALGLDLIGNPDLLLQPAHAAMSAAWFWDSRGLNALADDRTDDDDLEDFTRITRLISGGTVGLRQRLALLKQLEPALA